MRPASRSVFPILVLVVLSRAGFSAEDGTAGRVERRLDGPWQFRREGAETWKEVAVPSSFEGHEGNEFDGVGWYRRTLDPFELPEGHRALLHFEAAATEAEVWWDDQRLGGHLGGWTPFRFDVTDLVRGAPRDHRAEVRVRLDEKVGHNTQGFLPIIAPHFGGLWQGVALLIVPETYLDDLRLLAIGNPDAGRIEIVAPLAGKGPAALGGITVRYRLMGQTGWTTRTYRPTDRDVQVRDDSLAVWVTVPGWKPWTPPYEPNIYEVEIALEGGDRVATRAAFRKIEVDGERLRLNGKPLAVRGVLSWGYYPPLTAPNPGEDAFREDLLFARSRGFNPVKCCLWFPPRRFLELADELGMLVWMEYPTWHPKLDEGHRGELTREFAEFFARDRNHPSVVLRSLTCETGPGADLEIIRGLYELAHEMVPGCVVEDDSSWIQWNRVCDFYDDHPYGNDHTWVAALGRLKGYIREHGAKPLLLGEAIAADTWVDRGPILTRVRDERPSWLPGFFDANGARLDEMREVAGPGGLDRLRADSLRYGMLMRKYQVETYRREVPDGGYVVSVLRDFPLAGMGLIDYLGRPKWGETDWDWQRDTLTILKTPQDRRAFSEDEDAQADVLVSHFGRDAIRSGTLSVSEVIGTDVLFVLRNAPGLRLEPGTIQEVSTVGLPLRSEGRRPKAHRIFAYLEGTTGAFRNVWTIWAVPRAGAIPRPDVFLHESCPAEVLEELFPGAHPLVAEAPAGVVVATRFDERLLRLLEGGARVLLLPDGREGSFPLAAHWFLRGGPYIPDHSLSRAIPRDFLVDLQAFDLAGDVIPDVGYLDQIDPILMLWDNHDIKEVKTHGLVFEAKVGEGRLMVSALNHGPRTNAAGRWLLDVFLDHLANGPGPKHASSEETRRRLREKLDERKVDLEPLAWRFRPDPKDEGLQEGWNRAALDLGKEWGEIRVGRAWEPQGYPRLDGWAWYRLAVEVPEDWKGKEVYLTFQGVDDVYELYVDGRLAGRGGDLATRKDAFHEKKSHRITPLAAPGKTCQIAVRVHDWYGAGGIFRPVTLGTAGLAPGGDVVR
jgi:hypothetical protein